MNNTFSNKNMPINIMDIILFCAVIITTIATVAIVPDVRHWSCAHFGILCIGLDLTSNSNLKSHDELKRQRQIEEQRIAQLEREKLEAEAKQRANDELKRQRQIEEQRIAQLEREKLEAEALRKADEQEFAEIRKKQREIEAMRITEEQQLSLSSFDGVWFSNQYRYGFKIKGKHGIATISNSSNFSPGDQILRFEPVSTVAFRGEQIFTDGRWYPVFGELIDQQTLKIQGGGFVWTMLKH